MEVTPSEVDSLGEEEVRGGVLDSGRSAGGSLEPLEECWGSGVLCLGGGFVGFSANKSDDFTFFASRSALCFDF